MPTTSPEQALDLIHSGTTTHILAGYIGHYISVVVKKYRDEVYFAFCNKGGLSSLTGQGVSFYHISEAHPNYVTILRRIFEAKEMSREGAALILKKDGGPSTTRFKTHLSSESWWSKSWKLSNS